MVRIERVFDAPRERVCDSAGQPIDAARAGHDPEWPRETIAHVTFEALRGRTRLVLGQNAPELLARKTGAYPSGLQILDRLAEFTGSGRRMKASAPQPEMPAWRVLIAIAGLALAGAAMAGDKAATATEGGAYARVNGIRMYYEQHGSGTGVPLVLLHGGGSTIDVTFGKILPHLARQRRVIAVEERAHGRSGDRRAPLRFDTSADDVAALLRQLDVERADLLGFSNGASVALQVAIRHPELVRKLVFASSMTKRDGAYPQLWALIETADFGTMPQPLKDAFLQVNPDPAKLRNMHDKDAERMRHFEDVPDAQLRALEAETLVLLGDRDIVKSGHAVDLTQLIPGARLMILPGGHGDYLGEALTWKPGSRYPELTAGLIGEFLEAAGH